MKLVHIQFNSPESLFGHRCPCFSTQQCSLSFRVNWWYTPLLSRMFSFESLTSFWKLFCLAQIDNPFTLVMKLNSALSTCGYLPFLSPIKLCFSNFHVHTNHLRILLKSRYKTGLGESLWSCSAHVPPGEFQHNWSQHHSLSSKAVKQLLRWVASLQENVEVFFLQEMFASLISNVMPCCRFHALLRTQVFHFNTKLEYNLFEVTQMAMKFNLCGPRNAHNSSMWWWWKGRTQCCTLKPTGMYTRW